LSGREETAGEETAREETAGVRDADHRSGGPRYLLLRQVAGVRHPV
jgi:hypothetical protein